jgi:catechol 2,3-dioxygenase-like lactoylglutathione lyase family enzyme
MAPDTAPAAPVAPNEIEVRLAAGILALNRFLMTLQNKRMPVSDIEVAGDADGTAVTVGLDCPEETARRYLALLESLEDVEEIRFLPSDAGGAAGAARGVWVERLDHLVLTVADPDATVAFYERVLGMEGVVFGEGRRALAYAGGKINLHGAGAEFEPRAQSPTPGSADLCFEVRQDIPEVVEHLRSCGVEVVEGPVGRAGALGPMTSVYLRDPDGNLVELSKYGGTAPRGRG